MRNYFTYYKMNNKSKNERSPRDEQNCASSILQENEENFLIGKYNQIEIIYRQSDGYINASKLCSHANRDFRTFKKSDRFRKITKYWNELNGTGNSLFPSYELKKIFKVEGQYIHPRLIHFVVDWISIEYAFKVQKIMDLINEKNKLTNQTLDETITQLTNEVDDLKKQIGEQNQEIIEKEQVIEEQKEDIQQNHNRSTKYNSNTL